MSPLLRTNTPSGVGGTSSLDFGTSTGNYVVESPAVVTELGGLTKFTITGWVNNRSSSEGSGGNRVVTWTKGYFSGSSAPGVDLVYRSDGSLHLGVDEWVDDSNARSSSGKITTSSSADSGNWRFFAVTYDSTLGSNNVKFYFGSNSADATLDSSHTYNQGAVDTDIGKLAVGHFNDATRSGATDRMFRGLIDEIHIFDDALTLAQIQDVQDGVTPGGTGTPPAAASGLSVDPVSPTQVNLSWTDNASTETGFVIERATDSGFTTGLTRFAVGENITAFSDTSAQADTTYHYRVIATGQGGASTASNAASVTTAETGTGGGGSSVTQIRTHNAQNQLSTITTDGGTPVQLAYDANGNLAIDQNGNTLIYDAWNRLVEVKDGSTTLQRYEHDALKRRIAENAHAATPTVLYYSADWQVIEERDGATGEVTTQYVWSPVYVDAMVLRDRDANANAGDGLEERVYVTHDANFNVTSIVSLSGQILERYVYLPYGDRTILNADWTVDGDGISGLSFNHGHQGGKIDIVTGLIHFRHREYSSALGRWVQQDPMGYVDGMSSYLAVTSNPVVWTDPNGHSASQFRVTNAAVPPAPREGGHNEFSSKKLTADDFALKLMVMAKRDALQKIKRDVLLSPLRWSILGINHYLNGTGISLRIPVIQMLKASSTARDALVGEVFQAIWTASGIDGRAFRLMNQWHAGAPIPKSESLDWFGFFRGYLTISEAEVTREGCDFTMEYTYHVFKQYNFDAGEEFGIGFPTGDEMARLHDVGLAQNYDVIGSTSATFSWTIAGGGIEHKELAKLSGEVRNLGNWS